MNANAFARFGRALFTLLIVVLSGLGTAHILVRTASYGAAIDADSILHLSTAVNVLAGEGWRDFTGLVVVGWPPLFPLLLAALGWVGIEPLEAGRLVNATAFGLTILVAGCWLCSNLRSRWLALAASVTILAALPLSDFASRFLTEPLFVLFTLLALVQLGSFLNRKAAWSPLLWAAVFTALAALTRYAGVTLIAAGVLVLLPLARLKQTLVFGAISSVPLLAVLVHNWTVYGPEGGYDPVWENDLAASQTLTEVEVRRGSGQSLFEGMRQAVEVFGEWVVPPNAPDEVAYLLGLAVATVVLAGVVVVLRARRPDPEAASPSFGLGSVLPLGGFAVTYLVFMVAVVPFTVDQGMDSRYLLPVYVPLLVAAVLLLDRFLSIESKAAGWMTAARYGLASLVLLGALAHVGYSAHRNLAITDKARVVGFEDWTYNGSYWESFEILHYIRDNPINGYVYSDNPYLVWFWERTAAPGKHRQLPDEIRYVSSAIKELDDSVYILWFRGEKYFRDYDDYDIRYLHGVEPVAELADGVIFRVTATEPFDAGQHRARKQRYVRQLLERAGEPVIHADSTWPISAWGAERAGTDEQVARAGWDVYRNGYTLTYRKKPCAPDDMQTTFLLHVSPKDPADLPAHHQLSGFDNLDFNFRIHGGVRLNDQCVATAQLPDYPISRIHIGRWIDGNTRTLWEIRAKPFYSAEQRAQRQRYVEQLIQQADEQVARAGWNVYRTGRQLIYRKQPCAPADVQAKLVLHIIPTDLNDLPAKRKQHGYDGLGFYFNQRGFRLGDQCIAIAQLPDYPIGHIRVGQWIAKEDRIVWEAEFLESDG